MEQDSPSRTQVITEQPVSRNEMMRDPGVQRRRGRPPAHSDEEEEEVAGERKQVHAPRMAMYTTPGHHGRRRRRTEAGPMSDGIFGLVGSTLDAEAASWTY
ncbi:uncharacterized protein GLRG_01431 [Colletotrichum graminicola M1.001]|uniref:Uncharacterized protein n=1 Tax=Colletotrichum graminicola (strain M1.001 / M2 / FGSC 10212) TaxID=645133 RepID=E3Q639_COLGM|nr:uncharacterized protein GLRG_01431 [Colletotrichum graminicola M1.001]EFQ26287.1 hypothetical protein GLRG_01431 [Colletotrichum graminicola M1.001]